MNLPGLSFIRQKPDFLLIGIMLASFIAGCSKQGDLIQSPTRLADIQRMLDIQKQLTHNNQVKLWDVFERKLTSDERQGLEFLYAYMPLSDLADYTPAFFLGNVRESLKARKEMPWGREIPEDVFLHFVLPLRVNNENLDSFRMVMYDEIKDRVKGLSMEEAALEINHWCHEKVNYRATDSRTSAPLSTVKKTFGRCGEESTFTVSAMRTAGIPARQVYTPRWAHIDDNHAWVEVWINGKWYYMGACEPEPVLNRGWFTEPSKRAMLVHTRAYGHYFGHEEVITAADRFSELNLTRNYAPAKTVAVSVKLADGTPADSAEVEFRLYNYAEYYPIATEYTNRQGMTQLSSGFGDLLVWAAKGGAFSYQKLSVAGTDTLFLVLDKTSSPPREEKFDMVPPHAIRTMDTLSRQERRENDHRLALEDSIRNAYGSTFKDSLWSDELARKLNLNQDTVRYFIAKSYGNWRDMASYLEKNHRDYRKNLLALADQLSDKDFSDASEATLTDHLRNVKDEGNMEREIFTRYVLSPRIYLENLSPWRSFLAKNMGELEGSAQRDIGVLVRWIREHIQVDDLANKHSRAPLTPIGVFNLRASDMISRDIFFVATCRTFGIPARLNPVTLVPEYFNNKDWIRVVFNSATDPVPPQGFLTLTQAGNPIIPQYYVHFTLGAIRQGHYTTLEFEEGRKVTDFQNNLPLDTGRYVLVTGNRLEDGSVLSSMTYFTIEKGKRTVIPVKLRTVSGTPQPSGKLDLNRLRIKIPLNEKTMSLSNLSRDWGMVIVVLDPGSEPSKHVLSDLSLYSDHFNRQDIRFILVTAKGKSMQDDLFKAYSLPRDTIIAFDDDNNIIDAADELYGPGIRDKLPLVLVCDKHGNVFLFSAGYKIGIGEQILKLVR
jgi:hypothetical protein